MPTVPVTGNVIYEACNAGKWYDKSGYGNNGTLYNVQCVDLIKKPVRILQPVR